MHIPALTCLLAAAMIDGALLSTAAMAAQGTLAAYRGLLSPAGQLDFDYRLANLTGRSLANLCHAPAPGDERGPAGAPCHAARPCSTMRRGPLNTAGWSGGPA